MPTAGGREEPDERLLRSALDAALEVRRIARDPEELELEREHDGVERGAGARLGRRRVERVEEPRQRGEGALVRLLLREQPQHRLEPDQSDLEAVRVAADRVVRADERGAGDRLELAATLMEHELDVGERLQAGPEARLRLAHALRDRADAAASRVYTCRIRSASPSRNERRTTASDVVERAMAPVYERSWPEPTAAFGGTAAE